MVPLVKKSWNHWYSKSSVPNKNQAMDSLVVLILWHSSSQSYRGWQTLLLGLPQSRAGTFRVECMTDSQYWVQKKPRIFTVLVAECPTPWTLGALKEKSHHFPPSHTWKKSTSSAANVLCRRRKKWPTLLYQRLCWGLPSMQIEQPRTRLWTYKSFSSNQAG